MGGVGTSGLVGGDEVRFAISESSSDLDDELVEAADFGTISGALYESMFVVCTSETGPEILFRMEP